MTRWWYKHVEAPYLARFRSYVFHGGVIEVRAVNSPIFSLFTNNSLFFCLVSPFFSFPDVLSLLLSTVSPTISLLACRIWHFSVSLVLVALCIQKKSSFNLPMRSLCPKCLQQMTVCAMCWEKRYCATLNCLWFSTIIIICDHNR